MCYYIMRGGLNIEIGRLRNLATYMYSLHLRGIEKISLKRKCSDQNAVYANLIAQLNNTSNMHFFMYERLFSRLIVRSACAFFSSSCVFFSSSRAFFSSCSLKKTGFRLKRFLPLSKFHFPVFWNLKIDFLMDTTRNRIRSVEEKCLHHRK